MISFCTFRIILLYTITSIAQTRIDDESGAGIHHESGVILAQVEGSQPDNRFRGAVLHGVDIHSSSISEQIDIGIFHTGDGAAVHIEHGAAKGLVTGSGHMQHGSALLRVAQVDDADARISIGPAGAVSGSQF